MEDTTVKDRRRRLLALFSVALTGLLVACGGGTSESVNDARTRLGFAKNADGFADIGVKELAELLEREEVTLVNVHIPYEGELPGTDLFIPYDEIADYVDQLPDKDAPVILYCRSGGMSTSAAQELAALGYTSVLEVDGGFKAWKAAGYELVGE
jgi:rhodanese-related sulfurtransferase